MLDHSSTCLNVPKNLRLVVFDLDGTLIDTMGSFADIAGELISRHYGWRFEKGKKRYLETSGIPFFQQLETLFPNHPKNKLVVELFERAKISSFLKAPISHKTIETLQTLRDREIGTAISSNNFDILVKEFVHRENVPIDLALGYKPHFSKGIVHFDYIKKHFGIPFDEMVFVGDSLSDAQTSIDHDIQFIAKIGTFSESDFRLEFDGAFFLMIHEIYEILGLLEV